METIEKKEQRIRSERSAAFDLSVRLGLRISAGLAFYFLIMNLLGLAHIVELRVFNFVILGAGLYVGLRNMKKSPKTGEFGYFRALSFGFRTSLIAAGTFAFMIWVYLSMVDPSLLAAVAAQAPFDATVTPLFSAFVVLMEGLISGFLMTFVLMQGFKRPVEEFNGMKKHRERMKLRSNDFAAPES